MIWMKGLMFHAEGFPFSWNRDGPVQLLSPVMIMVMTKTMMSSVNDQIRNGWQHQKIMMMTRQTPLVVIQYPTLALRQNNLFFFDCPEKYRLKGPNAPDFIPFSVSACVCALWVSTKFITSQTMPPQFAKEAPSAVLWVCMFVLVRVCVFVCWCVFVRNVGVECALSFETPVSHPATHTLNPLR